MAPKNHPGFSSGRTVKARDLQYIQRPADAELLDHCRNGRPAYILHSPQMGKSSLIAHTAEQLNASTHHAVLIDLSQLSLPPREEEWFHNIVRILDDSLDLSTDAMSWWEKPSVFVLPPYIRLTKLITEIILPEITKPLVLFIDEIERTVALPFREHFFEWLSTLYESRATNSSLYRLSFVVCGVATPSQLIPEGGPLLFQWSHRVVLSDFTLREALPLAEGLSLPTDAANEAVQWIYRWTKGHPYLTQLLCQLLEEQHRMAWLEEEVDECIRHFIVSLQGLRDPNFQFVRTALTEPGTNGVSLLKPYLDLLEGKTANLKTNQAALEQLRLVGVLREDEEEIAIRNTLYQEAFPIAWVKRHLHPPTPTPQSALATPPATKHSYVMAASLFLLGVGLLVWFFRAPVSIPLSVTSQESSSESIESPPTFSALTEITKTPQQPEALAQAQEKIKELEVTIAEFKRLSNEELLSVQKQRAQLEAQRQSQETTISDLRAEAATMEAAFLDQQNASQQALLNFESERAKLTNTLASTTNERDAAQLEAKTLGTALLKQSSLSPSEIKQLITDRTQLESQLTAVKQELAGVQQEARELTASLAQQELNSKSEVTRWDRDRAQLQTQLNTVRVELQQTKDILTGTEQHSQEQRTLAQQELTQLGQARADVQQQLVASQDALNVYHDRISALETQNTTYSQDLKKTLEANSTLSAQLQDSQQTEAQILNRVGQLESDLIQQQNTADAKRQILQQERDQLSQALANTMADLETTNNRLATLTAQLESSKQELANRQVALQDIHAASSEKNQLADNQLTALVQARTDLESRLHQNEEALFQAHQHIAELEGNSEKTMGLSQALEASKAENHTLSAKLSSTQKQLETLQENLKRTPAVVTKEDSEKKGATTSHEAQIRGILPLITAAITNPSTNSLSESTRLLWARQAYLFSLQLGGELGPTIDQALRNTLRTPPIRLKGPKAHLNALAFNSTGDWLIGGVSDGSVLIWTPSKSSIPQKFFNHSSSVLTIASGPNGHFFASGAQDSNIRLWKIGQAAKSAKLLQGHIKAVTTVAFSPNGKILASGGLDRSIRLWDLTADKPTHTILGTHSGPVTALAFTPNGRHLISAGKDTNLLMWDLKRKETSPKILGQQFKGISTVSMHPILEILASGGPDQPITIWNLSQPVPIPRVLNDKIQSARHLQFSPNGKKLVALNSDNKIQVWNWQHSTTTPIVLPKLKGQLETFDMSPDGLSIAVGGKDLNVSLWSSTSKLVEDVCDKVTRNLSFDEWKQLVGENLPYERTCDNFPIHPTFLEEAENLAKQGAMEKASSIFKRAKALDPYLEIDPKKEVKKLPTKSS